MVLVNMCNLVFEHFKIFEIFNFNYASESVQHVNYVLDLRPCVFILPKNGNWVPKHIGVGT